MAFDLKINKSKNHDYPKSNEEWASWINELHRDAITERRPQEFQWAVNFAYYLGYQHLNYSPVTGMLHRDIDNEELIINRIAPYVETRTSKITKNSPILTVVPDKNNRDVREGAKLSELLVKYLWKTQNMSPKLRTFALMLNLTGSAFFKTLWNPGIGDKIEVPSDKEDGILKFDSMGEEQIEELFTGDIETHIRSPFAILASPGATSMMDATWVIDRTHLTKRKVKEMFPHIDLDKIKCDAEMTEYESFVNRLQSPIFSTYVGLEQSRKEKSSNRKENQIVLVKEFWMAPNEIYEDGLVATVIGDTLVDLQEFPEGCKNYPIIRAVEKEHPFNFYGQSTVTRLIPLQRRYNAARTQISKNSAIMANVKWWAPKGHGMHEDALTDEEGEVVESNPNLPKPQQLPVVPLPNYVMESQMQDLKDIREISGEIEASQIPGAPQITAGVALETAAELSDVIVQPVIKNVQDALVELGRQWLISANENYTDPRTLRIIGADNQVLIKEFDRTDLKYQTDVSIQIESALGSSKAAQQQKLLDMWDRRIITDPQVFLRAFMSGDLDIIMSDNDNFENVIAEDIEAIKDGKQPPVNLFDNHVMYIKRLSEFIQSPEFRRMPPDRQQIAMTTLQGHIQMVQPVQEQAPNPAAVNTPFGSQVPEGTVG